MKVVECDTQVGVAEINGVSREVSLVLLPQPTHVGDWILVHAGYAISRVNEQEAQETLALLRSAAEKGVLTWDSAP